MYLWGHLGFPGKNLNVIIIEIADFKKRKYIFIPNLFKLTTKQVFLLQHTLSSNK